MSCGEETSLDAFLHRDHLLPHMTTADVAEAMIDFPVALQGRGGMEWLAMATRRALAFTMRHIEDGPDRTSNAVICAELDRLAAIAQSAWRELFECDQAAQNRLLDYAFEHSDIEGTEMDDGTVIGLPAMHIRYKAAIGELDWLASFIRSAAKTTESQRGPWRLSVAKSLRVERGHYLAPIFEAAFGQPVSANNYPNDARHKTPTPFMDFYSRMVTLAFGPRETSNLSEVVKAACQLHRQHPVQFGEGKIPGL